ncbi:MAG: hypothetical protein HC887_07075 [Desulfobacteraceae bacterium]|nr:hypothetical protein [Desulfobacteraceae bacterium]
MNTVMDTKLMNPETYALILKIVWTTLSLTALCVITIILFRFRSIFRWKQALKKDLKALGKEDGTGSEARMNGIRIIEEQCRSVFEDASPDIEELRNIPQYITAIAACYYPDADRPELHIRIGSLLQSLDISLNQFDSILKRPGFEKIGKLRIRHLKDSYRWYRKFAESRIGAWYLRHRINVHRFLLLRLFILPDPLSWAAYLSRHLTLLLLLKCLMADIYLSVGRLALNAYDIETKSAAEDESKVLEQGLEALENLEDRDISEPDPGIAEIRERFTNFRALIFSDPTFAQWKTAVYDAACHISRKYFPESDNPLEEACVAILLEQCRTWSSAFLKGEEYPVLGRFYNIRLYTLYQAKNLTDILLPAPIKRVIANAGKAYRWLKWPLRVYLWVRKISPWQIALDVGWSVGKKAGLSYLSLRTFDKACREIDNVYRQS